MMAKKKVVVEYTGGLDHGRDEKIDKEAKTFKGSFGGSGFFFPNMTRDLEYAFKDERKAKAFAARVRKAFKVKAIVE
jgi:hypothetical protein